MTSLKKTLSTLLLFTIFNFNQSFAQVNSLKPAEDKTFLSDYVHRVYTTADGLPAMTVTSILQDNKGYIWIGTYNGLIRFDGIEFVTFSRYNDPKYDFAAARTILEDSRKNIWIGHNDEGISCLEPDEKMSKFTTNEGLPNNSISALCEDKDGNIWVGTNVGIRYFTPDKKIIIPEGLKELGAEHIEVMNIMCDKDGKVWITSGESNGVFIYDKNDGENGKFSRFKGLKSIKNATIRGICQTKDGSMWFGVDPTYAVCLKDGKETVYNLSHRGIDGTAVDYVLEDKNGNLWFSTDSGVTILHDGKLSYYDRNSGSPDNGANEILQDREGNFWICYNRGGLEKLSSGKFKTISMPVTVNSVTEDTHRKLLWIATDNGLYAYKDNTFIENEITRTLKGARVRNVEVTPEGEIFVASYSDKTPFVLVTSDNQIKVWSEKDGFTAIKNRIAIKTRNGDCYCGTTQGLFIWCADNGQIIPISKDQGFENEFIMWIYEDIDEKVWIGTNGAGIYILDNKKIVKHYNTGNGLSGNIIFKISKIQGNIWISTSTGLSKYDEKTDTFFNYNATTGLGTDSIFQFLLDSNNTAWMTTNNGIFSIDFEEMNQLAEGKRKTVSIKNYGRSDGLDTNGVTSVSCGTIDSKGNVYFALTDGFTIYNPENAGNNKNAPKVEIQEYSIDNVKHNYQGQKIILPAGTKRLSIKFTGLSFISSESIRFKTQLVGFDKSFSDWSSIRNVIYTNLRHGNYKLFILSQNGDGIQSDSPSEISIVKRAYFWELWWFWALFVLFCALIAFIYVEHKIQKMRLYEIELEQKVEERTHELMIANEKAEHLLLNILPSNIATELTEHPDKTIAKKYPNSTVLFTDIVGFTKMSGGMTAENVVNMLNEMISRFDERAKKEGIEKIKTIGDAYMAACGLSENPDPEDAAKMVRFAIGLLEDVKKFNQEFNVNIQIRVGINTGNLVAGVIGKSKFIYDIWGDTVNVASRMESTGEPMKIHVSEATYDQTKTVFDYEKPVEVSVKGKGEMKTFFLSLK